MASLLLHFTSRIFHSLEASEIATVLCSLLIVTVRMSTGKPLGSQ